MYRYTQPQRLRPGDKVSASGFNGLLDLQTRITTDPLGPLEVSYVPGGQLLRWVGERAILIQITGSSGTSPIQYSWEEVYLNSSGSFVVKPNGLVGGTSTGYALELANQSVSAGTVYTAWRGLGDYWYFAAGSGSSSFVLTLALLNIVDGVDETIGAVSPITEIVMGDQGTGTGGGAGHGAWSLATSGTTGFFTIQDASPTNPGIVNVGSSQYFCSGKVFLNGVEALTTGVDSLFMGQCTSSLFGIQQSDTDSRLAVYWDKAGNRFNFLNNSPGFPTGGTPPCLAIQGVNGATGTDSIGNVFKGGIITSVATGSGGSTFTGTTWEGDTVSAGLITAAGTGPSAGVTGTSWEGDTLTKGIVTALGTGPSGGATGTTYEGDTVVKGLITAIGTGPSTSSYLAQFLLPATVDLSSSIGSWVDAGITATIPGAGNYLVDANVWASISIEAVTANQTGYVSARLVNAAGTELTGSRTQVVDTQLIAHLATTAPINTIYTATGADSIHLQCQVNSSGGTLVIYEAKIEGPSSSTEGITRIRIASH